VSARTWRSVPRHLPFKDPHVTRALSSGEVWWIPARHDSISERSYITTTSLSGIRAQVHSLHTADREPEILLSYGGVHHFASKMGQHRREPVITDDEKSSLREPDASSAKNGPAWKCGARDILF